MCTCTHDGADYECVITADRHIEHVVHCYGCEQEFHHAVGTDSTCPMCTCSHSNFGVEVRDDLQPVSHVQRCYDCNAVLAIHQAGTDSSCYVCTCTHADADYYEDTGSSPVTHYYYCSDCQQTLSHHNAGTNENCKLCTCSHLDISVLEDEDADGNIIHMVHCNDCNSDLPSHAAGSDSDCVLCTCTHEPRWDVDQNGMHVCVCSCGKNTTEQHAPDVYRYGCDICESSQTFNGTLILPAALTTIQENAFAGVSAERIVIPENVSVISSGAFADCPNLKILVFEGSPDSIADDILPAGCRIACAGNSSAAQWAIDHGFESDTY